MSAIASSRVLPRDLVGIGSVGLRTRRLRATLSAIGIAIGIASMVAVLGLSESSRAQLLSTLDSLGTNLLTAEPGQTIFGDDAKLPSRAEEMIKRIGPVTAVSATRSIDTAVRRTDRIPEYETNGISLLASDVTLLKTLGGSMADGVFLNDATKKYPAGVLGAVAAERLGIEGLSGRVKVYIDGHWFTVVGILDEMPLAPEIDRSVLIGRPISQSLLGADNSASKIYVRANPDDVEDVSGVLGATANPERPEEVAVSRPSDALAARAAAKAAFTSLFLGLGAVALLVGGVGIANVMVISVLERRSEIGLRRAIGATKKHVAAQFLMESLLLAGIGGTVGVLLGALATAIYAGSRGWVTVVPPAGIMGGVGSALVIGAVAGLYPAARAARLSPTDALRSV